MGWSPLSIFRFKLWGQDLCDRNFCYVVIAVICCGLSGVVAFNALMDPYAEFGTGLMPPLIQTTHRDKVTRLLSLSAAPEGLVVGSSRVHKLDPKYLLRRTGRTFFNAGVNYGKSEDALAMLRLYQEHFGKNPEILLIGVDTETFTESRPEPQLLRNPRLSKLVADQISWHDRWSILPSLCSWQLTKMSLLSCGRASGPAYAKFQFNEHGKIIYSEREEAIRNGTFDLLPYLASTEREYAQIYSQYRRLSHVRKSQFQLLIDEAQTSGSDCYVFLSPIHPQLRQKLCEKTEFAQREAEVKDFLNSASREHGFRYVDLSQLESFEGEPFAFFDGVHPQESNTRQMIDHIFEATDAIQ